MYFPYSWKLNIIKYSNLTALFTFLVSPRPTPSPFSLKKTRSYGTVWLKLILNSDQGLALFKQKQILLGRLVTKIYKNKTMKISLLSYSMLGYI